MRATSENEAWKIAYEIFPTDYIKDEAASERAGYSIYRSSVDGHYYDYICDLGNRLEINLNDNRTINIWIDEPKEEPKEEPKADAEQIIINMISNSIVVLNDYLLTADYTSEAKTVAEQKKKRLLMLSAYLRCLKNINTSDKFYCINDWDAYIEFGYYDTVGKWVRIEK